MYYPYRYSTTCSREEESQTIRILQLLRPRGLHALLWIKYAPKLTHKNILDLRMMTRRNAPLRLRLSIST